MVNRLSLHTLFACAALVGLAAAGDSYALGGPLAAPSVKQPRPARLITELGIPTDVAESAPAAYTTLGRYALFFSARGGLYRTDGTREGTELVVETFFPVTTPIPLAVMGGRAYWNVLTTLWVTDGTTEGTRDVITMRTFQMSSPFAHRGALYFSAGDNVTSDLYRSDGTAAGTQVLVRGMSSAGRAVVAGDVAYFACSLGTSGTELCVTDGTAAGTRIAAELAPGPASSDPRGLGVVGNTLLFLASAANGRYGLWARELTTGATEQLLAPTLVDAVPRNLHGLAMLGANAYFPCTTAAAGDELCRSNGTPAGTAALDLVPGVGGSSPSVVTAGARLILRATSPATGFEMWTSDGTVAGTSLIRDLIAGPTNSVPATHLRFVGGAVYFPFDVPTPGTELWKTDGTTAGTVKVQAVTARESGFEPALSEATVLDNRLVFSANDGIHGQEPWVTNGSTAGTVLLQDVAPLRHDVRIVNAFAYKEISLLRDNIGRLWTSNGTAEGTRAIVTGQLGVVVPTSAAVYYTVNNALWWTTGEQNISKVMDLPGGFSEGAAAGTRLAFAGPGPSTNTVLWISDGTERGTMATDVTNATRLASSQGKVWFSGSRGADDNELWVTDGTVAGTRMVHNINPSGDSSPGSFIDLGTQTLFIANDNTSGRELWLTDGTAAGTRRVSDLRAGPLSSDPRDFTPWKNGVVFTANDSPTELRGLWFIGPDAVPKLISRKTPDGPIVGWGDYLFFTYSEAGTGNELWRSDGTAAGTKMAFELIPGEVSSDPGELQLATPTGPLYFAANALATGRELYRLEDPLASPSLFTELASGPRSSTPRPLWVRPDLLLLEGDTGAGNALWRVNLVSFEGDDTPPPEPDTGGCGCATGGKSGSLQFLLALAVLLAARRRRRPHT